MDLVRVLTGRTRIASHTSARPERARTRAGPTRTASAGTTAMPERVSRTPPRVVVAELAELAVLAERAQAEQAQVASAQAVQARVECRGRVLVVAQEGAPEPVLPLAA